MKNIAVLSIIICLSISVSFAQFTGGINDGFDSHKSQPDEVILYYYDSIAYGGIEDGYSSSQSQPDEVIVYYYDSIAYGGIEDGYSSSQSQPDEVIVYYYDSIAYGGVEDGYSSKQSQPDPVIVYYYDSIAHGSIADGYMCDSSVAAISLNNEMFLSYEASMVLCFGTGTGSVDLIVTGGTYPLTFHWSNNATTEDLSGIPAGNYTVTVYDFHNQTLTASAIITQPDQLQISYLIADETENYANDGSVNITTTGGVTPYSFIWSDGSTAEDLINVPANPFYVTITDSNGCTLTFGFQVGAYQSISLVNSWNIYSLYIHPINSNISDILDPFVNQVIIVKDGEGNIFWPQYGVNSIGAWQTGKGYQIKMISYQLLTLYGEQLVPENTPVNIPIGWSMLGYLRQNQALIELLLQPIQSELIIVKDGDGMIYWPTYGINQIINMLPGRGYQIKMSSGAILTYPAN
jgi:hypothetical protein